ncbi:hypothetical protein [Sandaracinus amylolyticus]|uniref:hypothetical protein n=1 Tax=Sandaracinus amylolyticus TaxID=927083 RepID=UPI00069EB97C|nr:hypothetical protein [Sandaracinus amylolyticus]
MSAESVSTHPLAALMEAEQIANEIMSAPTTPHGCAYEFNAAIRGTWARFVLAQASGYALHHPYQVQIVRELLPRVFVPAPMVISDALVSAFLFGAWSTIETLIYAANALGFALDAKGFRDVRSSDSLRDISIGDVLGGKPPSKKQPRPGYAQCFPRFTRALVADANDVWFLKAQTDLSKHRRAVAVGGTFDVSWTNQLHESIRERAVDFALRHVPMTNVTLDHDPSASLPEHMPARGVPLEDVERSWRRIVHAASAGLRDDLRATHYRADP